MSTPGLSKLAQSVRETVIPKLLPPTGALIRELLGEIATDEVVARLLREFEEAAVAIHCRYILMGWSSGLPEMQAYQAAQQGCIRECTDWVVRACLSETLTTTPPLTGAENVN